MPPPVEASPVTAEAGTGQNLLCACVSARRGCLVEHLGQLLHRVLAYCVHVLAQGAQFAQIEALPLATLGQGGQVDAVVLHHGRLSLGAGLQDRRDRLRLLIGEREALAGVLQALLQLRRSLLRHRSAVLRTERSRWQTRDHRRHCGRRQIPSHAYAHGLYSPACRNPDRTGASGIAPPLRELREAAEPSFAIRSASVHG